jgi:hypothetical protein
LSEAKVRVQKQSFMGVSCDDNDEKEWERDLFSPGDLEEILDALAEGLVKLTAFKDTVDVQCQASHVGNSLAVVKFLDGMLFLVDSHEHLNGDRGMALVTAPTSRQLCAHIFDPCGLWASVVITGAG